MNIKIHNPNKLSTIDYRKVIPFQGTLKDLSKKNYEKLKKSIIEHGFFVPMFLWKKGIVFYAIDTHQRLNILKNENARPYELPYILIEAKDEQEAKKKLLVISSQYGTITQEGIDAFSFDLDPDWLRDNVHFDALTEWDATPEIEDDYEPPAEIVTDI